MRIAWYTSKAQGICISFSSLGVGFNKKKVILTKTRQIICGKTRILDCWGDDFEIELLMVVVDY